MYYVNGKNKKSDNYIEKRCNNTQPLSMNNHVTSQQITTTIHGAMLCKYNEV